MSIYEYPRFEDLHVAPDFLRIGANAIDNMAGFRVPLATDRSHPSPPRSHAKGKGSGRTFASVYAGVRLVNGHWVAIWGKHGHSQGSPHPPTPDGERAAAQERATALGYYGLEMRP